MNRRQFIQTSIAAPLAMAIPQIAGARTDDYWQRDRVLWLRRQGRDEEFRVVYWSNGQVDYDNYIRMCYILRDATESQTVAMDVNLLNLLYGMQYWQELLTGRPSPWIVTSGFRTVEHNRREGGVENSEHLHGRAGDLKSLQFTPGQVAQMARFFGMGGVGVYDTFTHVDTGRLAFWNGKKRLR